MKKKPAKLKTRNPIARCLYVNKHKAVSSKRKQIVYKVLSKETKNDS